MCRYFDIMHGGKAYSGLHLNLPQNGLCLIISFIDIVSDLNRVDANNYIDGIMLTSWCMSVCYILYQYDPWQWQHTHAFTKLHHHKIATHNLESMTDVIN